MDIHAYDAIVVGSGAAGFAAAVHIARIRKLRVCIVTEGINTGTSRNTGSDKQTYYKLGLSGSTPDSVREMAQTLFDGGCVDGDNALCEAALSARCFLNLCEAGVPFPVNRYGEYVGYKTDHDPKARATSAGPLTSKFMTEALERTAQALNIPVYDRLYAVEILKDDNGVCGLLCLQPENGSYVAFSAPNVILATGGPAGIYKDSVYPQCHHGSTALALRAGAALQNMTEWQYGLASKEPRWNVSGTYMQVLPRFVSTDRNGAEHEFLLDHFGDPYTALSMVFLKGYQWPFDIRKVRSGSSVIDLLVYRETVLLGRRVFLDYTRNPFGLDAIDFSKLSPEAGDYLNKAGACFGTPIQRLAKMNAPAVELYRSKGVDLHCVPLEIALSAQHCNGGVAVDDHWQTRIPGLYAVGELAGTHGITRPGGSALNAGQVGALRAAEALSRCKAVDPDRFTAITKSALERAITLTENSPDALDLTAISKASTAQMSACAGAVRNTPQIKAWLETHKTISAEIHAIRQLPSPSLIHTCYLLRDVLDVQCATLTAMVDFSLIYGFSRGSALYTDSKGTAPQGLDEVFSFTLPENESHIGMIQTVELWDGDYRCSSRPVRQMPPESDCFETVWQEFRERSDRHV